MVYMHSPQKPQHPTAPRAHLTCPGSWALCEMQALVTLISSLLNDANRKSESAAWSCAVEWMWLVALC
jgi:hypothetical protein